MTENISNNEFAANKLFLELLSLLESACQVDSLTADASLLYLEIGFLVFVIHLVFFLLSGIACALADFSKDSVTVKGDGLGSIGGV